MTLLPRRALLIGSLSLLGAGAATYGGSLAVCSGSFRLSGLVRPLRMALAGIADPDRVGRAYLEAEGPERVLQAFMARDDLIRMALIADQEALRAGLADRVRQDFATGDTILAANWVVARTEALVFGAARL